MFKRLIYPVSTLTGAIIGVGIFSLPYIALQVGLFTMLGYFLLLGFFILLIHFFYADVALKTPDFLRLPTYAKLHLGEWARRMASLSLILGSLGSLLAYLIVGGEFLRGLCSQFLGGNVLPYVILYFILGSSAVLIGVKAIAKIEFWGMIVFFIVLMVLFIKGFPLLRVENLLAGDSNLKNIFLPFGPIIFSLWGATMIPEIEEMMIKDKKDLKKVILISILISALVYILFTVFILGISGSQTTESALSGLVGFLGKGVLTLGFIFGFLATFTSFIAVGLNLKNTFHYDFKLSKILSWFLVCFIPLFLYLIGMKDFIAVIGFVGTVALGIEAVLILLIYKKLRAK